MPFTALSARDLRALQWGGLVVLAALAYTVGVRPSRERRARLLEQLDAERAVLARERAVVDQRAALKSTPDRADSRQLFRGADAVVASSSLVEYVATAAETHDVWLQQAVTTPPKSAAGAYLDLQVTVRAESDVRGLLRWLAALERGAMVTQVQSLDVRSVPSEAEDDTSPVTISATVRSVAERQRGAP